MMPLTGMMANSICRQALATGDKERKSNFRQDIQDSGMIRNMKKISVK
jgi:hypothetical protein